MFFSRRVKIRTLSLASVVLTLFVSHAIAADDLCSVAPGNCKILKEDAKVRVLEFNAKKGDITPLHSHPAYVIYIVKGGKSRFTLEDGTTFERNPKDGEAIISPPVTHSEECLADQLAILVELKQ
jgi:quercetin dioxygenase-like cupin family protein